MNKIVVFAFALAIFLIGCGGGGGGNGNTPTDYIHALFPELPPDPGSAGKAMLLGIDSNKNGVRDDVEVAIYKYAPKDEQKELRESLLQMAKTLQKEIIAGNKNNKEEALLVHEESARSILCHTRKNPKISQGRKELTMMQVLTVNTDERTKAIVRYNSMLSGGVFSNPDYPIPCDYDQAGEEASIAAFKAGGSVINATLPPDPGSAGKATLSGIDSDGDGIRDDVQIAIWEYAPRPDQKRYRAALFQLAKTLQDRVNNNLSNDIALLKTIDLETDRALDCIGTVSFKGMGGNDLQFLQKILLNTPARVKAYYSFTSKNIMSLSSNHVSNPCDIYNEKLS